MRSRGSVARELRTLVSHKVTQSLRTRRSHLFSARGLLDRALPIMTQVALDGRVVDELLGRAADG